MVSANLLVHILAAVALFAFGWWALSLHKRALFLRKVMRWAQKSDAAAGKRFIIMDPYDFLDLFSNAVGASFTCEKRSQKSEPLKIRPQCISKVHLSATVTAIHVKEEKLTICCEYQNSEVEEEAFLDELAKSLGFDSCKIEFK